MGENNINDDNHVIIVGIAASTISIAMPPFLPSFTREQKHKSEKKIFFSVLTFPVSTD